MEIIYQSSRCFWKQRCNVDIVLVEHQAFAILELITYEPKINVEAPRIYLDLGLLKSTLHRDDLDKRLHELREQLLRRKQSVDEQLLMEKATNDALLETILGQLVIKEYNMLARTLEIGFQSSVAEFVCAAPIELMPHQIIHKAPVSEKEVTNAFGGLVLDMLELHKHRDQANTYQHGTRPTLNARQRWRLGIVCCKVARGKRLGPKDAMIWSVIADRSNVSSASNGAELIAAFAASCESPRTTVQPSAASEHSPKRQPSARSRNRSPRPDASPRRSPLNRSLTPPRRPSFSMGVAALSSSLQRSLSKIADNSIDPANKYYRTGAALDLEDTPGDERHVLQTPRREAEAGADPVLFSSAGMPLSRPNSAIRTDLTRRNSNSRSPRRSPVPSPHHSPRPSQIHNQQHSSTVVSPRSPGDKNEIDIADLGFKQRARKERPQSAAEKANQDLLLARMMKTVAAVGGSIRRSFTGSGKVRVQPSANSASAGSAAVSTTAASDTPSNTPTNAEEVQKKGLVLPQAQQDGVPGGDADGSDVSNVDRQLSVKPQPRGQPGDPPKNRVVRFLEMLTGR